MGLAIYVARRLILFAIVLLGVIAITFLVSRVIPGDPVRALLGPTISEEVVAEVRHRYGLDRPLYEQFITYFQNFFTGNLGKSIRTGRPVLTDLLGFLPATLELTLAGSIIGITVGIGAGSISALKRNTITDHFARVGSLLGLSMPAFWLGLVLIIIFSVNIPLFPTGGRLSIATIPPPTVTGLLTIDSLLAGRLDAFSDAVSHLALPSLVLGYWAAAWIARVTRTSILEVIKQEHVIMARAKGLKERQIFVRHVLRNGLIPPITLAGLLYGYMLEVSIVVEAVFSYPGIGTYAAQSILYLDYLAIVGVAIVMAIMFATSNLLVDLIYPLIDPRIKHG